MRKRACATCRVPEPAALGRVTPTDEASMDVGERQGKGCVARMGGVATRSWCWDDCGDVR
jgi:hypothetical protein